MYKFHRFIILGFTFVTICFCPAAFAENSCGRVEVCPEADTCQPTKNCRGDAKEKVEVGSQPSLAIARCETEQAAQIGTCQAL